tara:strand:- start:6976 stop:8796 length:1821 start_codon:yes stop_codon:yes gene_type:complete
MVSYFKTFMKTKAMHADGASDEDIVKYINSQGLNPEEFKKGSQVRQKLVADERVQKLEKELYGPKSTIGKVADTVLAVTDVVTPGKSNKEFYEGKLQRRVDQIATGASKKDVIVDEIKAGAKDTVNTAVDAALLVSPAGLGRNLALGATKIPGFRKIVPNATKKIVEAVTKKPINKMSSVLGDSLDNAVQVMSGEFIRGLTQSGDVDAAAKSATVAGASTGAMVSGLALSGKGITGAAKYLGKILSVPAGVVTEQLTQIPRPWFKKYIDAEMAGKPLKELSNKDVLDLGKRAKQAMREVLKNAKDIAEQEMELLSKTKTKVDLNKPLTDTGESVLGAFEKNIKQKVSSDQKRYSIQNILTKAANGDLDIDQTKLNPKESLFLLNVFKKLNAGEVTLEKLNFIKQNLRDEANRLKSDNVGTAAMWELHKDIGDVLKDSSESYRNFTKKYAEAIDLEDMSKTMLKEFSAEKSVKKLGDGTIGEAQKDVLQKIDNLAPQGLKFMEDIENGTIANALSRVWSSKNYLSDSSGTAREILTATAVGTTRGITPLIARSPVLYKQAIKGGAKVARGGRSLGDAVNRSKGLSLYGTRLGGSQLGQRQISRQEDE